MMVHSGYNLKKNQETPGHQVHPACNFEKGSGSNLALVSLCARLGYQEPYKNWARLKVRLKVGLGYTVVGPNNEPLKSSLFILKSAESS